MFHEYNQQIVTADSNFKHENKNKKNCVFLGGKKDSMPKICQKYEPYIYKVWKTLG